MPAFGHLTEAPPVAVGAARNVGDDGPARRVVGGGVIGWCSVPSATVAYRCLGRYNLVLADYSIFP